MPEYPKRIFSKAELHYLGIATYRSEVSTPAAGFAQNKNSKIEVDNDATVASQAVRTANQDVVH